MDFDANSREKFSSLSPILIHSDHDNLSKPRDELSLEDSIFSSKGKSLLQDFHPYENLIDLNESSSSSSLATPIFTMQPSGFDLFDNSNSFGCLPNSYDFYETKPFGIHGAIPPMDNIKNQSELGGGGFWGHSQMPMPMFNFINQSAQNQSPFTFIELTPTKYPPQDEGSSTTPKTDLTMVAINASTTTTTTTTTTTMAKRGVRSHNKKIINVVKGPWTAEEDRLLIHLVESHGVRNWSHISQFLNGRIGKQCRERWTNHLRPDIKKTGWTEEEDRILINAHAEIGNKWAEIARRLPGRSENSIKNHWNATKRKQLAKRKCKSKYPRQSSLLQKYINSLSPETINVGCRKMPSSSSTSYAPPMAINNTFMFQNIQRGSFYSSYNYNGVLDINFDAQMLEESGIDSLLDGASSMDSDGDIGYDDQGETSYKSMNDSQVEVKMELGLVERMKQVNL